MWGNGLIIRSHLQLEEIHMTRNGGVGGHNDKQETYAIKQGS